MARGYFRTDEIVHDGSKKNRTAGEQGNIARTAFASWAKEMLD